MKIYLVGGAVRDALLGRKVHDRDFVLIGATAETFCARFPAARRLGRSATYILRGEEYTLSAAPDILSDLASRDLTVNALARDEEGRLHAHPQALADLEQRVLRPVRLDNFLSDPLRVFRAARLAALFPHFSRHELLGEAMRATTERGLLSAIAAERVGQEVRRACSSTNPGLFLRLLADHGALDPWLSELASAARIPAGPPPHHQRSLLAHLVALSDRLAGDPLAVWMAICHDLGKAVTDPGLWPQHHGHDRSGEPLARGLGHRLRLPGRLIEAGAIAARWHMLAGRYGELRPATKVKLLMRLHRSNLIAPLFRLVAADQGTDYLSQARKDLARLIALHLPQHLQGLGTRSGEQLHQLRCQAIADGAP